jgi:hypothetical protein
MARSASVRKANIRMRNVMMAIACFALRIPSSVQTTKLVPLVRRIRKEAQKDVREHKIYENEGVATTGCTYFDEAQSA